MFTKVKVDPEIEKMVMEFVDILNQRHTELSDLIKKLEKRLDNLEKEPKVINNTNYYTVPTSPQPGIFFPPTTDPYKVWCGSKNMDTKYE